MAHLKRNITIYYIYSFLTSILFIGAVLVPFFKNWGGLDQTQIQTLQSIFYFAQLTFEVPTGVIADRFGRKTSLILGALAWVIGVVVYTSSPSFWVFALAESIFALGVALISGANQALLYDTCIALGAEEKARKIISRTESVNMLGIVFGNLVGSFAANFIQLQHVFLISIIPQFGAFLIAFAFVEPVQRSKDEVQKWYQIFTTGVKTITHSSKLRFLSLDLIYISALSYFVIWFYQAKLEALGVPLVYYGFFSVTLPLFESFILAIQNKIEKLVGGERNYLKYSIIPVSIGFVAAGALDHWIAVVFLVILAGGFGLTRKAYYMGIANKSIRSENRATAISTISMLRGLTIALINPLFGALADYDLDLTLIIIGLLTSIGIYISHQATKEVELE